VTGRRTPGLVIFDCDGVLVDSERISVRVGVAIVAEHGWNLTEEDFAARFVGCSAEEFERGIAEHLGADLAREWDQRYAHRFRGAFESELEAVHGVVEVLRALETSGVPTCVASNSDHAHIDHVLELAGLHDLLAGRVFSAHDVAAGKPAPDLFLHAARTLGTDPEDCVVVEDSPFGAMAARAAGMRCYGYAGGLTPAARLAEHGAVTFDRMQDLLELLGVDPSQAVA
jgi:HAD superfamily hydrolase (TIGR01509 family)